MKSKRVLKKAPKLNKRYVPVSIPSDKAPPYGEVIREFKAEGMAPLQKLNLDEDPHFQDGFQA